MALEIGWRVTFDISPTLPATWFKVFTLDDGELNFLFFERMGTPIQEGKWIRASQFSGASAIPYEKQRGDYPVGFHCYRALEDAIFARNFADRPSVIYQAEVDKLHTIGKETWLGRTLNVGVTGLIKLNQRVVVPQPFVLETQESLPQIT